MELFAYDITPGRDTVEIVVPDDKRIYQDEATKLLAARCLPMRVANSNGWFLLNPVRFGVTWTGDNGVRGIRYRPLERKPLMCNSLFGSGIMTFPFNLLFRTPPGYNLLLRGPANCVKDGIAPLEGLVETDWSTATATMNWKLTRKNHEVIWEKDEPFAMIVPMKRGEIEQFEPVRTNIAASGFADKFRFFKSTRNEMAGKQRHQQDGYDHRTWQAHYMKGVHADESPGSPDHQTHIRPKPFREEKV